MYALCKEVLTILLASYFCSFKSTCTRSSVCIYGELYRGPMRRVTSLHARARAHVCDECVIWDLLPFICCLTRVCQCAISLIVFRDPCTAYCPALLLLPSHKHCVAALSLFVYISFRQHFYRYRRVNSSIFAEWHADRGEAWAGISVSHCRFCGCFLLPYRLVSFMHLDYFY